MTNQELSSRQILNQIYKDICGFEIPKTDEKQIRESKGSPVYGEINYTALNKLLHYLEPTKNDVFYDLGSGVGKVIIQTALNSPVKKAVGVELSTNRSQDAKQALMRAEDFSPGISSRASFLNEDLMTSDLSDATLIYTCSTAFSKGFMTKVCRHLANFPQHFRLITLQDLPHDKDFSLQTTLRLDMSWVRNTAVYVYRRK